MGFVRVGTEVSDAEKAKPFIERAREKGMFVFSNLMKSYVCDTGYFVPRRASAWSMGRSASTSSTAPAACCPRRSAPTPTPCAMRHPR